MATEPNPRNRRSARTRGRDADAEDAGPVPPADFVGRVVADPAAPPAVWVLAGYPGPSAHEGYTRLYLSPDLSGWLEIPNDAIVHTQEIPPERNLLGAVLMWVRQDARIGASNRWMSAAGR